VEASGFLERMPGGAVDLADLADLVWSGRRQSIRNLGSGAGEGIRTLDNQLGRLELYQLSYTRIFSITTRAGAGVASRLEPSTSTSLEGWSSTS
jgi:hypothetical protein